ncbi:MAG: tRNA pseudouridine(38-40) synthase TruA [Planctomycetaceae bacterium]|nr:tRNA pseudouridine(38-40) synthase TruA [Planctomycetaceae bacterium]
MSQNPIHKPEPIDLSPDSSAVTDQETALLRHVMLRIAYRGTAYCGWQVQPNGPSVQQHVEAAIRKITGRDIRILCAGRTDSGVHAVGQVASFQTDSKIPAVRLQRAIQSGLPEDIVILEARDVSPAFHATFSAVRKRYRYVMCYEPTRSPFLLDMVHPLRRRPDVDAMQEACQYLLGTHDFRCFESHYPNKATSIRTILEAQFSECGTWFPWNPTDLSVDAITTSTAGAQREGRAGFLIFDIMADGFLYNMVRAIVGTLLEVGVGRHPPEWIGEVISSMDRNQAGMTAPASGLYLVHVEYPPELMQPPGGAQLQ